jgi:predicted enzyme related to lactoylglutathione lyase
MTVVTSHRIGEPCWVEYASTDIPRAQEFYTSLFGWTADAAGPEYGGYVTLRRDGHRVAGLGPVMGDAQPNGWLTYFVVEDAEASERAALDAGAHVIAPTMTVGEQGRMVVVSDPGGAVIGLWEPDQHRGFELVAEVGGLAWHELYARDYPLQLEFYTKIFGWTTQVLGDTADFRYATFGDPASPAGGVYDADKMLPEGVPSHWVVYFGVSDATAASQRVLELGGTVVRDPWDSEFGRFAQVTDPLGGLFFLHEVGSGGGASR